MKAEDSKIYKDKDTIVANYTGEVTSRTDAIRRKCLDCCCGFRDEVTLCPSTDCPLWPYRFGTNPFSTRAAMSDEQRAALRDRLAKAREKFASEEEEE